MFRMTCNIYMLIMLHNGMVSVKTADMLFRNGEKDLLSDAQSHAKDLNHRLPGYKTHKSRISPRKLKEQQIVYLQIMNTNMYDILSNCV
jgi:hypothetical protein